MIVVDTPVVVALMKRRDDDHGAVTAWMEAVGQAVSPAKRPRELGLADASLLALAARLGTVRIATLDERHFRTVPPLTGEVSFMLLPADM